MGSPEYPKWLLDTQEDVCFGLAGNLKKLMIEGNPKLVMHFDGIASDSAYAYSLLLPFKPHRRQDGTEAMWVARLRSFDSGVSFKGSDVSIGDATITETGDIDFDNMKSHYAVNPKEKEITDFESAIGAFRESIQSREFSAEEIVAALLKSLRERNPDGITMLRIHLEDALTALGNT